MLTGGCQCGEVRYKSEDGPRDIYVCHCRECQKQSASAFGISVIVAQENFCVTQGVPESWSRRTDSGGRLKCVFCPTCGSRLWHQSEGGPETLSIKGGSLDNSPDISTVIHIWTSHKMPGVIIPGGVRQFSQEPD